MWKVDSLWRWRGLLTRLADSEIEMSMFLQFLIERGGCYLCVHLSSSVLEHAFYRTELKQQGSRLYVTFILNISVKKMYLVSGQVLASAVQYLVVMTTVLSKTAQ